MDLKNVVLANNTASVSGPDCSAEFALQSGGHNLIGDVSGCAFLPTTGDLVGTGESPIDPMLGPLQFNGGPTFTHALLPESPAINAGDDLPLLISTSAAASDRRAQVATLVRMSLSSAPQIPMSPSPRPTRLTPRQWIMFLPTLSQPPNTARRPRQLLRWPTHCL